MTAWLRSIGVASFVLSASSGQATVLRVPQDFPTIQTALDAAAPGARVSVAPGAYPGSLDFRGKNLALESTDGPSTTTIMGTGGAAIVIGPLGSLTGFTITGGSASFGAGTEVTGVGTLIRGNVYLRNAQSGGGFGAGIGGNSASPVIEGNLFKENSCDGQFLSGVVAMVNSSAPLVVNNVFENNPCRAINLTVPAEIAPLVLNNTIVGNDVGIRVDRRVPSASQAYRNNIVVGNGIGLEVDFGSEANNPTWEHNLVFGNGIDYELISVQSGINGNLALDPEFMDPAGSDFRLRPSSPAIDTGEAAGSPSSDFDGITRPFDGNADGSALVDIGAFEFGPSCASTRATGCSRLGLDGKATFRIRRGAAPRRDSVRWHWMGDELGGSFFGDPPTSESYSFCLYESTGAVAFRAAVLPGAGWRDDGQGFLYESSTGAPDGIRRLKLQHRSRRTRLKIVASGQHLSGRPLGFPSLPLHLPVVAQLQNRTGSCWEATYDSTLVRRNDANVFRGSAASPSGVFVDED